MYLLLWLQCDWKKWKKGVFPKFGNFSSWKVYLWAVTHSDLPLLGAGGKSHSYCQHLGISARSDFSGVPYTFNGESWELLSKGAESLDLPSCSKQPPFSSPSQHSANFGIFSTAAMEQAWQLLEPLTHLCLLGLPPVWGDVWPWKKKSWTSLHPTPASLCTLGRMLSELNALSIPRGTKPSQAILRFILQTSWFSWVSLSKYLITILGKSLSLWALKTMDR